MDGFCFSEGWLSYPWFGLVSTERRIVGCSKSWLSVPGRQNMTLQPMSSSVTDALDSRHIKRLVCFAQYLHCGRVLMLLISGSEMPTKDNQQFPFLRHSSCEPTCIHFKCCLVVIGHRSLIFFQSLQAGQPIRRVWIWFDSKSNRISADRWRFDA